MEVTSLRSYLNATHQKFGNSTIKIPKTDVSSGRTLTIHYDYSGFVVVSIDAFDPRNPMYIDLERANDLVQVFTDIRDYLASKKSGSE